MKSKEPHIITEPGKITAEYGDRQWNVERIFSPDPGENCAFQGMELTDRHAILGGMDFQDYYRYGYVYFRDL